MSQHHSRPSKSEHTWHIDLVLVLHVGGSGGWDCTLNKQGLEHAQLMSITGSFPIRTGIVNLLYFENTGPDSQAPRLLPGHSHPSFGSILTRLRLFHYYYSVFVQQQLQGASCGPGSHCARSCANRTKRWHLPQM